MIWRSRGGYVTWDGQRYSVIDHLGAIVDQYQARYYRRNSHQFLVRYSVAGGDLIESTVMTDPWQTGAVTIVIERDLREDDSDETRSFLEMTVGKVPEPAAPVIGTHSLSDSIDHLGEDVVRTRDALVARTQLRGTKQENELHTKLLRTLLVLTHEHPSAAALTTYVRACLLLCNERAPAIDETWTPVASPLVSRVSELTETLEEIGAHEAAEAMATCAVLLGSRGTWTC